MEGCIKKLPFFIQHKIFKYHLKDLDKPGYRYRTVQMIKLIDYYHVFPEWRKDICKYLDSMIGDLHDINRVYLRKYQVSKSFLTRYQDILPWDIIFEFQNFPESFLYKVREKTSSNKMIMSKIFFNKKLKLSEECILEFCEELDTFWIISTQKMSEECIELLIKKLSKLNLWELICRYQTLSESFIYKHADKVDWKGIFYCQTLSEDFICKFSHKVPTPVLLMNPSLSESYLNKVLSSQWGQIRIRAKVSEDFIRKFQDKLDWGNICEFQTLSESFIREFKDKVDWWCISQFQKLSESFIREFKDKVDWKCISQFQSLSEDFIREFKDSVDWKEISQTQRLSPSFISEFQDYVYWPVIFWNQDVCL